MLLEDEDEAVDHRAEQKISAEPIITETPTEKTYCKVNYTEKEIEAHNSKGIRRARKPGSVEKPHSTCDLKSYNISRHSRKKEAIKQRLSSVKKRIMRSIENDVPQNVLLNLVARPPPIKGNGVKQELPSLKKESKDSVPAIGHQVIDAAAKLPLDKLVSKENQGIQSSKIKPGAMKNTIRPALTSPSTKSSSVNVKSVLPALTNADSTTNSNSSTTLIKPLVSSTLREPLAKNEAKSYMRSPRINKPRSKDNEVSSNSLSSTISGPAKQSKLSALLESSSVNELSTLLESPKAAKIKPSIRACPSGAEVKTDPKISHPPVAKRTPVKIERVDILPAINIKQNMEMSTKENPFGENINRSCVASQKPSELNATSNNGVDQPPKRPERRSSLTVASTSPIQAEKPMRRSSMTTVDTPSPNSRILPSETVESLAKAKKRTKESFEETEKGEAKRSKLEQNICLNFSLSANSKFDADSLLQLAEPLESIASENTLVEDQVKKDTKLRSPQKQESPTPEIGLKSGSEAVQEDLRLLNIVGLPIIKDYCFEDKLPLEQSENFRKTAAIFSKVYHTYDTIWSYRKTKNVGWGSPLVRLTEQLNSFCEKVNKEIGCHLTTNEMKRILNLINLWYAQQVDQRFFKKASPSYSVEHYMFLFNFLPKIHPVYFCEFCEETFPNESRHTKHVQSIHQQVHAFTCSECGKSFKRLYFYEKHFKTVHLKP